MNTVAAKIPSVFHRNVDAEGKKKRVEHGRSCNNKEKNTGSTTHNPHQTAPPKPTHNPTPNDIHTPPDPEPRPKYLTPRKHPAPSSSPYPTPTQVPPPPRKSPLLTPHSPYRPPPPKKTTKKQKKSITLAWGRLSPLSQWPPWCGKLGSGNQPASWWPPWCGSQERGGREATPLFSDDDPERTRNETA